MLCTRKLLAITYLTIIIFSVIPVVSASPVCSFSYSVRGCSISLTPTFNVDVEYYQWQIIPGDGTTILGCTGWIPISSVFVQMFSMYREGEYRVVLQVRSSVGEVSEYSRLVRTVSSSLSMVDDGVPSQSSPASEGFSSRFASWFNSFPLLAQLGFIVIVVFLAAVSFDAVFHVSRGWKKKTFYKTSEMKK